MHRNRVDDKPDDKPNAELKSKINPLKENDEVNRTKKSTDDGSKATFQDGTTIEGQLNDRLELKGKGKKIEPDHTKKSTHDSSRATFQDGTTIKGQLNEKLELNGKGKKIEPDGTICEGEFKDGKLQSGQKTSKDGYIRRRRIQERNVT